MPKYDEEELLNMARSTYWDSGGTEQPSSASNVTEINGVVYAVLRNNHGVIAAYQFDDINNLKHVTDWPEELE